MPIPVMQVIDSTIRGGAERVTLDLANLLPRERFEIHLCVTRLQGSLEAELEPDVRKLILKRNSRSDDISAARELARYVREHKIRILHCHKDSLFLVSLASLMGMDGARLMWHDHYGSYAIKERSSLLYRLGTARFSGIISVNQPLADWAIDRLRFSSDRVWYVANSVRVPKVDAPVEGLPGEAGFRIVCVANLRPQKDVGNLIRAMATVVDAEPRAHALIVGGAPIQAYFDELTAEVEGLGLEDHVHFLGERSDVPEVLHTCDIGVLSSASEGLPLALIEYGMAGLATVATEVGQCSDVLGGGRMGRLVPTRDHDRLADALLGLLRDPATRSELGAKLERHVQTHHGSAAAIEQICRIYDSLLSS